MSLMNAPVPLELDKPRSVLYSMGAARHYKKTTGDDPVKWEKEQWANAIQDPEIFPVLLWACLLHEDKTLAIDDVANLITSIAVMQAASIAIMRSYAYFCGMNDADIEKSIEEAKIAQPEESDPLAVTVPA